MSAKNKLAAYRSAILTVLEKHRDQDAEDVMSELITDREHDHYQLVNVGWQNDRRIYGCVLHLDILNNKIWIQHNGTEFDIAHELVEAGIDKQDIVLGFHSPFKRQFTGFAIH
ncbi:XisI protein [Alkalinema sp. FACHB-956]|uniref:XisI protein n=1 Tax=Alkalinema sp. FACHB-956 TaxID=2692768 RepID=UPI00168392F1|nr:XisI protein [Alkalinema sp. FACHB-956]MBD2326716.1 XisI protein [Alkalinema sp. FACHB-956]